MGKEFNRGEGYVAKYNMRTDQREKTLMKATMNFVGYFIALGNTELEAQTKVSQVSTHVAKYLYVYTLGNVSPLVNEIQNIDEIEMPFMNQAAKDYLINGLTT